MAGAQAQYKDRLFSFLFGSEEHREWTLSLYNAVNGSSYTDPEQISITTIRQVLYLGMHNDVSFMISGEMNMYEQQSSYNPNMPLRMLQYAGSLYEKDITARKKNKYSKTLIELPAPRLVVFYNGKDDEPDERTLRLSDAFPAARRGSADIEVRVRMININRGHSPKVMAACKPLDEYTWIVERVRQLEASVGLEAAIDRTIDEMPEDYLVKPYLQTHRAEVKSMLLTEYNEARQMELFREEGREEGLKEGLKKGHREGLREGHREGLREGQQKGQNMLAALISRLLSLGRTEDVARSASDPEYREKLFEEFKIRQD